MPPALKRNAIVTFALAIFFWWAFMFAKHDPALRPVIPFGEDPYDAVGSFGVIVGMLVALIALGRAFWPYGANVPGVAQRVYLLRTEVAVVFAVYITLAADAVALARHPAMWIGAASRNELLALLGGLAVVATATLLLLRSSREVTASSDSTRWRAAIVTVFAVVLLLALYPERLIQSTLLHLLTVVLGAIALFAPMRPILTTFVPLESTASSIEPNRRRPRLSGQTRWLIVLLVGALVGAFAFIGEMSEGTGHAPLRQLVLVAVVFVGLAIAGLLVAYAFLGAPLGFARR
ncbi:MAG TPA: hypothetical protein VF381_12380 [Thermoanaerobaculia bacterium]